MPGLFPGGTRYREWGVVLPEISWVVARLAWGRENWNREPK